MLFDIDLHKKLSSFSLDIRLRSNAKRIAIIGASGSGKSLMLQLLSGLLQADGGHICINEKMWFDDKIRMTTKQRRVGLLFQDYALFPHLTVAQNIDFGLKQSVWNPTKKPSEKAQYWLALFKLENIVHHYPHQISGGQKQRVALARALIVEPDLLLLDEPFSALDTDLREHTRYELKQLQEKNGFSMIMVTHDFADTEILADEVWKMQAGQLTQIKA